MLGCVAEPLPLVWYGLTGVCVDSAAIVELVMLGITVTEASVYT
jgi:hypothetical protein